MVTDKMNFRITKYNPTNCDSAGRYLLNEWTSVSDIGKNFSIGSLELADYLETEGSYVTTIRNLVLQRNRCPGFWAMGVEHGLKFSEAWCDGR